MPAPTGRLPRVVYTLGAVSLLTDVASEMVYPLLPTLLASMGAGALSLGAFEGVGDATAAVVKLFSGRLSDVSARRKPMVVAGYGLASLVRPLLALATAPWQVVGVRFVDRIGKGIRSSPRDALLAASVPPARAGAAFGLHRAFDNVGATVGPLLAVALLHTFGGNVRRVMLATLVPGVLAVVLLLAAVREPEPVADSKPALTPRREAAERPPATLRAYLIILGLFYLVNTSDLFLLRRLGELGASPANVAGAWALMNGVRAAASVPGGRFADHFGRGRAMEAGWLVFAASYAAMAVSRSAPVFVASMAFYALFYGFTEGAERALLASLVPKRVLGASFGSFHFVVGLALLPSNLLFGFAWGRVGGPACLAASAAGALVVLVVFSVWSRRALAGRPA